MRATLKGADLRSAVGHLGKTGAAQAARESVGPRSEVSRRLGVDVISLYRWETGRRVPRGGYLVAYARFLERAGLDLKQAAAEAAANAQADDDATSGVKREPESA